VAELLAGVFIGLPLGWYLNEFFRSVVPVLIRHGRR
jgi:F0F1-type ATP synthase assembly protein I